MDFRLDTQAMKVFKLLSMAKHELHRNKQAIVYGVERTGVKETGFTVILDADVTTS